MPGACMVEVWAKDFINKINDGSTDLDDFFISSDYFRINKLDIIYHYHQWAPMTIQCTARVWVLVELVQENLSDMQRSSSMLSLIDCTVSDIFPFKV